MIIDKSQQTDCRTFTVIPFRNHKYIEEIFASNNIEGTVFNRLYNREMFEILPRDFADFAIEFIEEFSTEIDDVNGEVAYTYIMSSIEPKYLLKTIEANLEEYKTWSASHSDEICQMADAWIEMNPIEPIENLSPDVKKIMDELEKLL